MIRCIQIGRTTIQGRVSATYPDPTGEHGAILSNGRVVMGRLTESKRANTATFLAALDRMGRTYHGGAPQSATSGPENEDEQ